MYHPSQLEKRFGGEVDTPTNYWPPYIGPEFYPNGDTSHLNLIKKEDYPQVLKDNPELSVHPEFIVDPSTKSRDFVAGDKMFDPDFIDEDGENV